MALKKDPNALLSTEGTERRYRGIRVIATCEHCGMPLPLQGPLRQVKCGKCLEKNDVNPEYWGELLDRLDCSPLTASYPDRYELDVTLEDPPETLRETAFDAPEWLIRLVPSVRRFFGAQPEDGDPVAVVDQEVAKPVVMSCPKCDKALEITSENQRITSCDHCETDVYLPDEIWRRLHPATKAARWYVEFEGESSAARQQRLQQEADRRKNERESERKSQAAAVVRRMKRWQALERQRTQLQAQRAKLRKRSIHEGHILAVLVISALLALGSHKLSQMQFQDPLFGLHSKVVCPFVCEDCTGPYAEDEAACQSGKKSVPVPGGVATLLGVSWAPWLVLCVVFLGWRRHVLRKKAKKARAEIDGQLEAVEAELADLDTE